MHAASIGPGSAQGPGRVRAGCRFYRAAIRWVNSVGIGCLLLATVTGSATAAGDDSLERAARDEERLATIIALVEAGDYGAAEEMLRDSGPVAENDARWINLRGLVAAGRGDHPAAVALFEAGLRRDPSFAALHRNLAISLVEEGVRGRALSEFRQATELDPGDREAWLGLGDLQVRLRRSHGARQSLERLGWLAPDDPRTWRVRAALADLDADPVEAVRAWAWLDSVVSDPESSRRLARLREPDSPQRALAHYADCIERDPEAVDCREQATRIAMGLGRHAEAVRWSAPALDQLSEAGYLNLLLAAAETGSTEELEAWVERRTPGLAPAWGVVALVRREDGRVAGAMDAVQEGLELAESADLYNLLGVLKVESGDRPGARQAWGRALELDPEHGPAAKNLAEYPG